jgi:hypothetical protein
VQFGVGKVAKCALARLPRVGGFWQSCRWTFAFQSSAFGKSRADGNKLTPSTVLRATCGRYGALLGAECGSSTTWKTVLHFGQTIGSRLRSKNAAPQLRHRRFAPSSAFATAFSSSEIVYAIYRDRAGFGPASASDDRSLPAPGLLGGLDPSSAPSPPPVHPRSTETGETNSGFTPESAAGRPKTFRCACRRRSRRKLSDHLRLREALTT